MQVWVFAADSDWVATLQMHIPTFAAKLFQHTRPMQDSLWLLKMLLKMLCRTAHLHGFRYYRIANDKQNCL